MDTLPDFSDLVAPVRAECRNHCQVYKLLTVMDGERRSKVIAAINAHDIPAALMARRFREANLPIPRTMLDRHRNNDCECCRRHGTLGE